MQASQGRQGPAAPFPSSPLQSGIGNHSATNIPSTVPQSSQSVTYFEEQAAAISPSPLLASQPLSIYIPGRRGHVVFSGTAAPFPFLAFFSVEGVDDNGILPAAEGLAVACAGHGAGNIGNLDQRRWEALAAVALCFPG